MACSVNPINSLKPYAWWRLVILFAAAYSYAQTDAPAEKSLEAQHPQAAPESVLVTGTFAPEPETEIDRSVSVVEVGQQDSLYKSWVDALQFFPFVDLRQRAPNDVQGDLSIRGSSFGQALVLVNGLRMDDVQSAHHDMDLPLPTESVERIEVLRGGYPQFSLCIVERSYRKQLQIKFWREENAGRCRGSSQSAERVFQDH